MRRLKVRTLVSVLAAAIVPTFLIGQDLAKSDNDFAFKQAQTRKSAYEKRQEAMQRIDAMKNGQPVPTPSSVAKSAAVASAAVTPAISVQPPVGIGPNRAVNINLPNFANSPNLRKFVDSLPGLGSTATNNLGQCIPVAVANTNSYPGSDYYELAVVEYSEKMHSDLPPTKLRGYVQQNGGDTNVHYLGPIIVAQKDRPVRVKLTNLLPTGAAGNLFLPVDPTIMGAGMGPLGMNVTAGYPMNYTQNRALLHLHGGRTPWISDGTPHQWTVPAGELTDYRKGAAVVDVPDMPPAGPGSLTYYWSNGQSARLMFYHDHAYGITRLNVYAGEAAGYLITDPAEQTLINGGTLGTNIVAAGTLPGLGIPLVIQDKTFMNDSATSAATSTNLPPGGGYTPTPLTDAVDPLWKSYVPGGVVGGNLWFPHEYMPNENPFDPRGYNDFGRWDYGPWMMPPMAVQNIEMPSPTAIPEAYMDTMLVNGTAFPYVELPPTAVRFRILNACNDRILNLQLYKVTTNVFAVTDSAAQSWGTEVTMVPALANAAYPTWPSDGRPGGVPDPTTMGPSWYQVGNEGGFLAQVQVVPPQPIDFDYNRRSVTIMDLTSKSLLLGPAVRADVVVDLSPYKDGDTLMLYNDAPAPAPLYDTRNDYYTDDPDQTAIGGAPATAPGFGPNTRTVMQIRIKGTNTAPYNLAALQAALPAAFAAGQDKIIVPNSAFNAAYGTNYADVYCNALDQSLNLSGLGQAVAQVRATLPGQNYVTPPAVSLVGGGGAGATAVATLNGVAGFTITAGGSGYSSNPTVTITPAAGSTGAGATAVAVVAGGVINNIALVNPGSNYTVAPTVTITDPKGKGAAATANITLGSVGAINVTAGGSGYTKSPYVFLTGGGGTGAQADSLLAGSTVMDGKNLTEGFDMAYGRMNAVLGSTPNPLTPTVGLGPVVGAAFYIDPPSEILKPETNVLWRLAHIGVDSHLVHFHLFDVQVVNRVDWTGIIKPPEPQEIGWKDTVRTDPFTDLIVALRPHPAAMKLPFGLPRSVRLLDPTSTNGSTMGFTPVAPPPGVAAAAQLGNVTNDFGWEYVWHCHLLGHEENDMMRTIVLDYQATLPTAPSLSSVASTNGVTLRWTDPTPFNYATGLPTSTLGNPMNEIGFRVMRGTGTAGALAQIGTALANQTNYVDTTATGGTSYRYQVVIYNAAGSRTSTAVTVTAPVPVPAVPTTATATAALVAGNDRITLTWTNSTGNNQTGFTIQMAMNSTFTTGLTSANVAATARTWTSGNVTRRATYYVRIRATNGGGTSAWVNATPFPIATP